MVFSTIIFLCAFLPITIIGYYLMPGRGKNIFLLLCSLFFYAWGEPVYVFVMLASIICNYAFGMALYRFRNRRKLWLMAAVAVNLGILCVFKYTGFIVENAGRILPGLLKIPEIALPIGISFYTFQGLSYCIDVYRNEEIVQKNPFNLALYISMFPQLIAGPIVRYGDVKDALAKREHSPELFAGGVERFIIGLSKKAILANPMGALAQQIMGSDTGYMGLPWHGWEPLPIRCRSTLTFRDIRIWPSALAKYSASDFPRTLTIPIFPDPSGNSGADGTSLCPPGLRTIFISPWAEAEKGMSICIFS